MTRMKRRTMMLKRRRGLVMTMKSWRGMMMVMVTWSNIAKSGNAPLSSSCVNIDLGQFQIKREVEIYSPTKIKINCMNSK